MIENNNFFNNQKQNKKKHYPDLEPILLAVDSVIFGFDEIEMSLKVLLIKCRIEPHVGEWSLMGGFVKPEEPLRAAAYRILEELTGLKNVYMEQFHTFGRVERVPFVRVVTTGYYYLMKVAQFTESEEYTAQWFDINEIPELIYDHKRIINMALDEVKDKIRHTPIAFELLPDKFTIRQLRTLYETILQENIDSRNFSRRVFYLKILKKLEEKQIGYSKKGSYYFKVDHNKLQNLEKKGKTFYI